MYKLHYDKHKFLVALVLFSDTHVYYNSNNIITIITKSTVAHVSISIIILG